MQNVCDHLIQTVKVRTIFETECFLICSWRFLISITLDKLKFKLENIIVIQKPTGKIRKELTFFTGFMLSILNLYLTKEFKFVS